MDPARAPVPPPLPPDPAAGPVRVDLTLVDACLALTPEERLRQNDRMLRTIEELRHGFALRGTDDASRPPGGERR